MSDVALLFNRRTGDLRTFLSCSIVRRRYGEHEAFTNRGSAMTADTLYQCFVTAQRLPRMVAIAAALVAVMLVDALGTPLTRADGGAGRLTARPSPGATRPETLTV